MRKTKAALLFQSFSRIINRGGGFLLVLFSRGDIKGLVLFTWSLQNDTSRILNPFTAFCQNGKTKTDTNGTEHVPSSPGLKRARRQRLADCVVHLLLLTTDLMSCLCSRVPSEWDQRSRLPQPQLITVSLYWQIWTGFTFHQPSLFWF